MGALLGQLINRLASDTPIVKELIRCQNEGKLLDLHAIVDYIRRISTSGQVTVIRIGADGLDELLAEHRTAFFKSLGTLSTESNIQFLFFGRDHSGIQAEVGKSFRSSKSFACYKISGASTVDDRRLFLRDCLRDSKDWSSLDNGIKNMIFAHLASPHSTYVSFCYFFFSFMADCIRQVSPREYTNEEYPGSADQAQSYGSNYGYK
jgi:hypothetical protein